LPGGATTPVGSTVADRRPPPPPPPPVQLIPRKTTTTTTTTTSSKVVPVENIAVRQSRSRSNWPIPRCIAFLFAGLTLASLFYKFLLGFTEFCRISYGFYWVLLGFTSVLPLCLQSNSPATNRSISFGIPGCCKSTLTTINSKVNPAKNHRGFAVVVEIGLANHSLGSQVFLPFFTFSFLCRIIFFHSWRVRWKSTKPRTNFQAIAVYINLMKMMSE